MNGFPIPPACAVTAGNVVQASRLLSSAESVCTFDIMQHMPTPL